MGPLDCQSPFDRLPVNAHSRLTSGRPQAAKWVAADSLHFLREPLASPVAQLPRATSREPTNSAPTASSWAKVKVVVLLTAQRVASGARGARPSLRLGPSGARVQSGALFVLELGESLEPSLAS